MGSAAFVRLCRAMLGPSCIRARARLAGAQPRRAGFLPGHGHPRPSLVQPNAIFGRLCARKLARLASFVARVCPDLCSRSPTSCDPIRLGETARSDPTTNQARRVDVPTVVVRPYFRWGRAFNPSPLPYRARPPTIARTERAFSTTRLSRAWRAADLNVPLFHIPPAAAMLSPPFVSNWLKLHVNRQIVNAFRDEHQEGQIIGIN